MYNREIALFGLGIKSVPLVVNWAQSFTRIDQLRFVFILKRFWKNLGLFSARSLGKFSITLVQKNSLLIQIKKSAWSSYFFIEFMVGNHCTYILLRFYVVWWWTIRNQINENCELISEVEFKTSTRLSSSTKSRLDQDRFTIHAILSDIYRILHLTFKNIVIITIEGNFSYVDCVQ